MKIENVHILNWEEPGDQWWNAREEEEPDEESIKANLTLTLSFHEYHKILDMGNPEVDSDRKTEAMMHEMFLQSLLDDMGAPTHPGNDPTRPPYGSYGRLKAYCEQKGIKASIWEPVAESPSLKFLDTGRDE